MERNVVSDSPVYSVFVSFKSEALDAAQRSSCSAETGISKPWIIIVQFSSCKGVRIASGEEGVQVFFMRNLLNSGAAQKIIIKSPADVVMTAEIVLENIIAGQFSNNIKLAAQKGDVSGCNSVPGSCHGCHIVKKTTFRFFNSSEIRNYFFRGHNNFTK